MSVEENKAIVKKAFEEANKGNIDAWAEAYSPNLVRHTGRGGSKTRDFESIKEQVEKAYEEGATWVLDDMMAEGDRIALWMGFKMGEIDEHYCFISRFSGGKIVEEWDMTAIQKPPKA